MRTTTRRLEGRSCLVTGGAGSIGRATARLFLDEGASVMLSDLDAEGLREALEALDSDRAGMRVCDVTQSAQVASVVAATRERFGALDVVFSNAGNLGVISPIAEFPEDVFDRVLAVHVRGAFLLCKHALPVMNDGGSIVITSSVAGVRGDPGPYGYITAKHAQVGLMRSVAKEVAPRGIRVNTLHPGPVDNSFQQKVEDDLGQVLQLDATAMFNQLIPLGRHARADEIARAALFLASDDSTFVTGSRLMVDGGMSA